MFQSKSSSPLTPSTPTSEYALHLSALPSIQAVVDLDIEAPRLEAIRAHVGADSTDVPVGSKMAELHEMLAPLPEPLLTQLYHSLVIGGRRVPLPAHVHSVICEQLQDLGMTDIGARALLGNIQLDPPGARAAVASLIRRADDENGGTYVGQIIDRPWFFRRRERFDLKIPMLTRIATLHRERSPRSLDYRLFDVGAWDGGLAGSLSPLYDTIDLIEPDNIRYDSLCDLIPQLERRTGVNGRGLRVSAEQIDIVKCLQQANTPERGYDTVLLSHVLGHLQFEDAEGVLRAVAARLRSGGISIVAMNDDSLIRGSRAHLRAVAGARAPLLSPHSVQETLRRSGLDVTMLRADLSFTCVSPKGLLALTDIVAFLTPGKARYEPGFLERYVRQACSTTGGGFLFRHTVQFIVGMQPDGIAEGELSDPTLSSLRQPAVTRPTVTKTSPHARSVEARTPSDSPISIPANASLSLTGADLIHLDTLGTEERLSVAAWLYRDYALPLVKREASQDLVSASRLLRLASALSLSVIDFSSHTWKADITPFFQGALNWNTAAAAQYDWRKLAMHRSHGRKLAAILSHITSCPSGELVESIPAHQDEVEPQPQLDTATPSSPRALQNVELFTRMEQVRDQQRERLLLLWPVQRHMLQAILSPKSLTLAVGEDSRSIDGKWFLKQEQHIRASLPAARQRLLNSVRVMRAWAIDPYNQERRWLADAYVRDTAVFLGEFRFPPGYFLKRFEQLQRTIPLVSAVDAAVESPRAESFRTYAGMWRRELEGQLHEISILEQMRVKIRASIAELNASTAIGWVRQHYAEITELDKWELQQEALLGMMRAVDNFELARGHTFRTYSLWWIRQATSRYRENAGFVRLPAMFAEFRSSLDGFRASLGYRATISEEVEFLAQQFNVSVERAEEIRKNLTNNSPLRLEHDYIVGWDQVVSPSQLRDIEAARARQESILQLRSLLMPMLEYLDPREREILSLLFGLGFRQSTSGITLVNDGEHSETRSLERTGLFHGLKAERIRQIAEKAIERLQSLDAGPFQLMREYLDGRIEVVASMLHTGIEAKSIMTLPLPQRVANALYSEKIFTIGDLCNCTEKRLRRISQLGVKVVSDIGDALREIGCRLRTEKKGEEFEE